MSRFIRHFFQKNNLFIVISVFLFLTFSFSLKAAELIEVPDGVVVRSIFGWEKAAFLKGIIDEIVNPEQSFSGGSDIFFTREELCHNAGYLVKYPLRNEYQEKYFSLSHLCQNQEKPLLFAVISDTQKNQKEHLKTARLIQNIYIDNPEISFVVNAGDLVQEGSETEWQNYRFISANNYSFFLPLIPVVGNHEYRSDTHLEKRDYLYSTSQTKKRYYTLDYPQATLIILNSNISDLSAQESAEQTAWLEAQLKQYTDSKPTIIIFHHAIFTKGCGPIWMPTAPKYIKEKWVPLFEKYAVKLVINGHEHIYERSLVNGIHYLMAGAAAGDIPFMECNNESSQMSLSKTRTVSLIEVLLDGRIRIVSYGVDSSPSIIDDYLF